MGHVLSKSEKTLTASGGPDAPGSFAGSFIAGTDPRLRIVAAAAFAVATVACHWIPVLLLALCISVCFMLAERLPLGKTLKRMAAMDGFIVFLLLLLPFTVPGDAIFTVWGFVASWEGVHQAVTIALKANAVVLMLMVLVGTLEAVTFGHALHALRVPAALVHLLLFTIRYVDVLHEEYLRLRQAMKARGFKPSNSLHTYRTFGYLVGMMLVRALERSERILDAMKCRGFTGAIPLLAKFEFSRRDAAFATLMIAIMGLIFWLEYSYAAF